MYPRPLLDRCPWLLWHLDNKLTCKALMILNIDYVHVTMRSISFIVKQTSPAVKCIEHKTDTVSESVKQYSVIYMYPPAPQKGPVYKAGQLH